jgi:cation diffusion facilitator CzcD-associated flavoprotein CzcO
MTMSACDVVVVGAGPYGLAAAAHLRAARLDVRVLGEPMVFWETQMPMGMLLRSPWSASHLSDPERALRLEVYQASRGVELSTPIPLQDFIAYGHWFQRSAVPDVDRRTALIIERDRNRLRVELDDGDSVTSRRVVVAAGIGPFAWRPPQFAAIPHALASHSADHRDLRRFADRDVLVVGGGQSALESAALLNEVGARVEVLVRAPEVHWLVRSARLHGMRRLRRLLYAPSDVGPAGVSWLVHVPGAFRRIPRGAQDPLARRSIRPAGAGWLMPRLRSVPIHVGRVVTSAEVLGERLRLRLDDGGERIVDHALLATGYRVDVARYRFLAPELLRSLDRVDGYPRLSGRYECSVPSLYFIGAAAAWSFGPLSRFVAGAEHAARAVTRAIISDNATSRGARHGTARRPLQRGSRVRRAA